MKRLVMTRAWEMFKKGFATTFKECLRASWTLTKKENNCFQETVISQDELNNRMRNDKNFRKKINGSNLSQNIVYNGTGRVEYTNRKIWIVKGMARVYATETIDNIALEQTYIQVRI